MHTIPIIASAPTPSSALDAATKAIVQNGFDSLVMTATDIIGMAIVAGMAVVALSSAAKFAVKYVRGLLHMA